MINNMIKLVVATLLSLLPFATAAAVDLTKKSEEETCQTCVSEDEINSAKGVIEGISSLAKMLQLATEENTKIITFNDETVILGIDSIRSVKAGSDVTVDYKSVGGENIAISVEVDSSEVVLDEKGIDADSLARLVFDSAATLAVIDARPSSSFPKGHIPGSISIYNGVFAKHINLLPKEKDQLIVYYCDGTS